MFFYGVRVILHFYTSVGKSRLMGIHMKRDLQVTISTMASLIQRMSHWHSALRCSLLTAQIASLHYLHILVVYLLYSSILWHRTLYKPTFAHPYLYNQKTLFLVVHKQHIKITYINMAYPDQNYHTQKITEI